MVAYAHDLLDNMRDRLTDSLQELYEPLWDEIYEKLRAANRQIRGIWIADVAHQGQSGVLNESILGDDRTWLLI